VDKWWWLSSFDPRWSREEVFARSQFGLAALTVFVLLEIPEFIFFPKSWNTVWGAMLAVVPIVFASVLAARPIATELWPEIIRAGDEKAAERIANEETRT
jgi:hypothetical protein